MKSEESSPLFLPVLEGRTVELLTEGFYVVTGGAEPTVFSNFTDGLVGGIQQSDALFQAQFPEIGKDGFSREPFEDAAAFAFRIGGISGYLSQGDFFPIMGCQVAEDPLGHGIGPGPFPCLELVRWLVAEDGSKNFIEPGCGKKFPARSFCFTFLVDFTDLLENIRLPRVPLI